MSTTSMVRFACFRSPRTRDPHARLLTFLVVELGGREPGWLVGLEIEGSGVEAALVKGFTRRPRVA